MTIRLKIKPANERLIRDVLSKHNLTGVYEQLIHDANFDLAGRHRPIMPTKNRNEKQLSIKIQGVPGSFWFLLELSRSDEEMLVLDFRYIKPPQLPIR